MVQHLIQCTHSNSRLYEWRARSLLVKCCLHYMLENGSSSHSFTIPVATACLECRYNRWSAAGSSNRVLSVSALNTHFLKQSPASGNGVFNGKLVQNKQNTKSVLKMKITSSCFALGWNQVTPTFYWEGKLISRSINARGSLHSLR